MSRLLADTTPLENRDYRRLWTAGIVTVIGAQLSVVAVPQQVYEITRSSAYVGLTGIFGLVPLVVFGLWGGALADVMDRRRLLMITSIGLGVTSVLFWIQAALNVNNVWLVLGLFSVQQAFFAVNQPTRAAIIPRLIPGRQLPAANSLNMTVVQFGAIAGPLLAGVLIPSAGLQLLYLLDSIFLLATLWAVWKLPAIPPTGTSRRAGLSEVLGGFTYLATQKVLLASFVVDIIAMVFGMSRALFPEIAHESFGDPASGGFALGLLFAAMSVGAVLGGVFSGWLPRVQYQGASRSGLHRAVGAVHGRLRRCRVLRESRFQCDSALGGGRVPGIRRSRRHGLGGFPQHDAPASGNRRHARTTAGRVHRGRGRWSAYR